MQGLGESLTCCKFNWKRIDIEDDHSGMLDKALGHLIPKAAATPGDDYQLTLGGTPLIRCSWLAQMPVIQRQSVQGPIESTNDANSQQDLQGLDKCRKTLSGKTSIREKTQEALSVLEWRTC